MRGWKNREMMAKAREKQKASRAEIRRQRAAMLGQVVSNDRPIEEPQPVIDTIVEDVELVADDELATDHPLSMPSTIDTFGDAVNGDFDEDHDEDDATKKARLIAEIKAMDPDAKVDGRTSLENVEAMYFDLANSDAADE